MSGWYTRIGYVLNNSYVKCKKAKTKARINNEFSDQLPVVNIGVHEGFVLGPLLLIIVLKALSREFKTGCT